MAFAAGGSRLAVTACALGEIDDREVEFLRLIRELRRCNPDEYEPMVLLLLQGVNKK